ARHGGGRRQRGDVHGLRDRGLGDQGIVGEGHGGDPEARRDGPGRAHRHGTAAAAGAGSAPAREGGAGRGRGGQGHHGVVVERERAGRAAVDAGGGAGHEAGVGG